MISSLNGAIMTAPNAIIAKLCQLQFFISSIMGGAFAGMPAFAKRMPNEKISSAIRGKSMISMTKA